MGLDMYLMASRFLYKSSPEKTAIQKALDFDCADDTVQVRADVMYWRKANAIHSWFVDNIQNGEDECRTYSVSDEDLEDLITLCDKVLEDPEQAALLLPTAQGFFFGSMEYDDDYVSDLKYTSEQLKQVLTKFSGWQFEYCSSW